MTAMPYWLEHRKWPTEDWLPHRMYANKEDAESDLAMMSVCPGEWRLREITTLAAILANSTAEKLEETRAMNDVYAEEAAIHGE